MVRFQRNIYGTQFHPELDSRGMTVRIHNYKHHGYFEPAFAESPIEAVKNIQTDTPRRILRRFVARYRP